MALNTQTTELTDLSPQMKIFYRGTLLDNAMPKLVHRQFGDKYPIPKNNGKTIEFRRFNPLPKATTPLTEGVTPDGRNVKVVAETKVVKQFGDFIATSDILEMTAIDNMIVQNTKLLGSQSGRTLDSLCRDELAGGTNVLYAPSWDDGEEVETLSRATLDITAKLTPDLVFKASAQLQAMNTDTIDGDYVAIIHPYAAYDLMRNDEWIGVHSYNSQNYYEGEIGKIGNVRFVGTTEAKIWSGAGCPTGLAVFGTLVFGAHAFAVIDIESGGLEHIVKARGAGEDPLNQRSTIGWKATDATKRLSEEYMLRIESCSSYSGKVTAN